MFKLFEKKAPAEKLEELERRVARLEEENRTLKKKVSGILDASQKQAAASAGNGQASGKKSSKEIAIAAIMEKTGWTRDQVISQVETVKGKLGITYTDYNRYDFHTVPEKDQKKKYQDILAKKEQKKSKQEKLAQKKARHIAEVAETTGWDKAYAEEKMEHAREVAGCSYEQYVIYRFWELSDEEQQTYFTRRDGKRLRAKYNTNPEVLKTLMNKDLCCEKLEAFLGRPWMSTKNMTYEKFCQKFSKESKIVYKPRAASGGHGIQLFEILPGKMEEIYNEICTLPVGIIEGYLVQHPQMKRLSANSVNTVRVVTIKTDLDVPGLEKNKVNFLYGGVRMGQGSSFVDNLHSGGMMAAIDIETGVIVTGGVDHACKVFDKHPDTGAEIVGFQIPYFKELRQLIEKASADLPGYFGWDIAITENGPVIVEVNTSPGPDGLQTPYVPQKRGMRHVIEKYL